MTRPVHGPRGAEKLRPLDLPAPIRVRTDDRGRPTAVETGRKPGSADGTGSRGRPGRKSGSGAGTRQDGVWERVIQIREVWRIDDEWWRKPLSRLYFEVVLENGARIVLFRDLVGGGWCR